MTPNSWEVSVIQRGGVVTRMPNNGKNAVGPDGVTDKGARYPVPVTGGYEYVLAPLDVRLVDYASRGLDAAWIAQGYVSDSIQMAQDANAQYVSDLTGVQPTDSFSESFNKGLHAGPSVTDVVGGAGKVVQDALGIPTWLLITLGAMGAYLTLYNFGILPNPRTLLHKS